MVNHKPEFTVIDVPEFHANPLADKTNSETFIIVNFAKRLVLIGGSSYGGEIKKSIFSIMNYLLPEKGPLRSRVAIARAFHAPAIYDMSTTKILFLASHVPKVLRRICFCTTVKEILRCSTFSRAFAEFKTSQLPSISS